MEQYIKKSAVVAKIRERLLLVIRDKHYDEWEEGQDSERIAILDIIDTLEVKEVDSDRWADTHPHWISVEDELPEENKWVLTYNGTSINLLMLAGNGGWYDHSVAKHRNVTHWMPLPAQPAKLSNVEKI